SSNYSSNSIERSRTLSIVGSSSRKERIMIFSPDTNACTCTASSNGSRQQSTSSELLSTSSSSSSTLCFISIKLSC
ncbi:MAG: hypothetical protein ACK53Y_28135, partial [bacterium]